MQRNAAEPRDDSGKSNPGVRPRHITGVLILRLGIAGFFVAASAVSLLSFTLFGCFCWQGYTRPDLSIEKVEDPPAGEPGPKFGVPESAEPTPPK